MHSSWTHRYFDFFDCSSVPLHDRLAPAIGEVLAEIDTLEVRDFATVALSSSFGLAASCVHGSSQSNADISNEHKASERFLHCLMFAQTFGVAQMGHSCFSP